jgi:hypothetical protein
MPSELLDWHPLVAARLQSLTQLLPGPDRFGDEFLAGTGAYTGSRAGHKADGTAPHHGGGSPLAPGGAPLMIALEHRSSIHAA